MKSNPDMLGSESYVWEKHLLTGAQDNNQKDQDSLKDLQTQLLKLQLTEARQKTDKSKKDKGGTAKVMMVAGQNSTPDLYPTPPWVPDPPNQPPNLRGGGYGRGYTRGGGGYRGRVGRGGPPRGQPGGNQCYVCGEGGHWARNCPLLGRGGEHRGRGRPITHNLGRGLPHPVPPIPHQMPQWDSNDEWGIYQQQ